MSSPLSQTQARIWSLMAQGKSVAATAVLLKTTRQFVNQTKLAAQAKLSAALLDAAQASSIQVTKLYAKEGVLLGYHPGIERRAVVTFSASHGIKVWYWYDDPEEVTDEEFLRQTRSYLLEIAKERRIDVKDARGVHPARLAQLIFSQLIPELRA